MQAAHPKLIRHILTTSANLLSNDLGVVAGLSWKIATSWSARWQAWRLHELERKSVVGEAEALNTPQKLQMTKVPYKDKRNLVTDIYRTLRIYRTTFYRISRLSGLYD